MTVPRCHQEASLIFIVFCSTIHKKSYMTLHFQNWGAGEPNILGKVKRINDP